MKTSLKTICVILMVGSITRLSAQSPQTIDDKEVAYNKVISERARKIVASLGITDSVKFYRIQNIVSGEYKKLGGVHDSVNAAIKAVKAQGITDKEELNALIKKIEEGRTVKLQQLHTSYLASLSAELRPEQVVSIKDGMTYNILPITFKAYQEMILTLTEEQKKQIYAYLTEARELAMDAESSEKKHAWFGKYKGRINNYLSAAGYDMKKEGEEWQKRIAAQKN